MRKLYEVLANADAEKYGQIRVIDESGEDYLDPALLFDRIVLPTAVMNRVLYANVS